MSSTFDHINKRVEAFNKATAQARAPFDRLEASFTKFTKVTGMDKIATGFSDVARAGTETFRSLARVVEPLAAITGAASVAGIYRLATAWGQFGTQLGNQAARAGLTSSALQKLEDGARLAGVSSGALATGMTTLNDNMRNAAFGGATDFISGLQVIGLNYDDIKKKTPEQALSIFADRIAAIKNPTDQAKTATALFSGAGESMLPFLRRGSKGMADLAADAARLNPALGRDGVEAADQFRMAQVRVQLAVEGFGNAISQGLAPAITPLLNQMAEWIARNDAWIKQDLPGYVKQLGDAIQGIPWETMGKAIVDIAERADSVAHALGGWEKTGNYVLEFFAARWLLGMLAPFAAISKLLIALPVQAAAAAAKASAALEATGLATKIGGLAGGLAMLGVAWEGTNLLDSATAPTEDGLPNLLHNMLFDTNPMHWTRDYHASGGGSAGSGGGPSGPVVIPSKGEQDHNARDMAMAFLGAGYTREGAAAMIGGGAMPESSMEPTAGAGTAHRGLFQWSDTRRKAIEDHFGKPVIRMTPTEQTQAAIWEVQTKPEFAGLNTQLRASHDRESLTLGVTHTFEAPGNYGIEDPRRQGMATGAQPLVNSLALPPSGEPASLPPAPALSGAPGASGRVQMNVRVDGAAQVTTTSTGDVGVKVENRNVARDGY